MSRIDQAVQCFNGGCNCSQAILSTYCEDFGLDIKTALNISCGMGAGMGRLGETCGAVTGAFLLIGLICGITEKNDIEVKQKSYSLIQEFSRQFKERNNSINCFELLGFDLNIDQSSNAIERVKEICPKMVRDSAEIIESIFDI